MQLNDADSDQDSVPIPIPGEDSVLPHNNISQEGSFQRGSTNLHVDAADFQPPNGGINSYLKVLGCFFICFITLGVASTFGSYQAYYETTLLPSYSSSAISWIGGTQLFLLSFIGTLSGAFYDRGYFRGVLLAGLTLIVLGFFMLSLSREYWQIMLTQGVCIGLGQFPPYVVPDRSGQSWYLLLSHRRLPSLRSSCLNRI